MTKMQGHESCIHCSHIKNHHENGVGKCLASCKCSQFQTYTDFVHDYNNIFYKYKEMAYKFEKFKNVNFEAFIKSLPNYCTVCGAKIRYKTGAWIANGEK